MNLRPYLLAGLALVLAGVLVWDRWPTPPAAPPVAPAPAPPRTSALNPWAGRDPSTYQALFDRPLFDPTRRAKPAVAEAPPPVVTVPAEDAAPAAGPPQPVLRGTVTSPWPGGAYLGDDQGGPVVFLRPGQSSQGLALEEVRPDSALFMGPEGEVTLPLVLAPAQPPAEPAPPPQDGSAMPSPDVIGGDAAPPDVADPGVGDTAQPGPAVPDQPLQATVPGAP